MKRTGSKLPPFCCVSQSKDVFAEVLLLVFVVVVVDDDEELSNWAAFGIGLCGFPQAILNFSQNVVSVSPSNEPLLQMYLSPLGAVVIVPSTVLFVGSGLVPADEPGPCCDTDDADGEEA